jgi:hypothetical protein
MAYLQLPGPKSKELILMYLFYLFIPLTNLFFSITVNTEEQYAIGGDAP